LGNCRRNVEDTWEILGTIYLGDTWDNTWGILATILGGYLKQYSMN
jgi:hypothetical protein